MRMQIVHLRINDAATNKPTPCRIRISDPSGHEYAPLGRPLRFSCNRGEDVGGHCRISGERWFSIDGQCEIALPPGELRVQVRKGIEYSPIDQIINQPTGKMAIRLSIERQNILGKANEVTIDTRCHFLTPHAAVLDAGAEALDYVQLLVEPTIKLGLDGNTYASAPNLDAFSGQETCLERRGSKVFVNTHNRHPILGSLGLLHCHRVVNPLSFGGADDFDDWSLRDWAGQCHRKGGLVVWTEPFASSKPFAGEALALAILGEIDAYELASDGLASSLRGWYQLLDAGIRLPIVGASGRVDNCRPLGELQTICYEDETRWMNYVQTGCCKVTNGPKPSLCIEGNVAHVSVISTTTFGGVELIVNGNAVARSECTPAVDGRRLFVSHLEWKVTPPSWIAARVISAEKSILSSMPTFGHTSAMWLGDVSPKSQAIALLKDHLDRARDWVEKEGRFEQLRFKKQLLDTFDEANAKLLGGRRS